MTIASDARPARRSEHVGQRAVEHGRAEHAVGQHRQRPRAGGDAEQRPEQRFVPAEQFRGVSSGRLPPKQLRRAR